MEAGQNAGQKQRAGAESLDRSCTGCNELWWVIERTAIPAWEGRVGGISIGRRRKRIRLDVVFGADDQAKGRKDEDNGYEGQYVGHWHYLVLK